MLVRDTRAGWVGQLAWPRAARAAAASERVHDVHSSMKCEAVRQTGGAGEGTRTGGGEMIMW